MKTLKNHPLAAILCLGFILRLVVLLLFQPWDPQVLENFVMIGDSPRYHRLALCILNQFSFCGDAYRTPGYPLFVALVYAVFGVKPWAVMLVQCFADLVSIYLIYSIGTLVFSRRAGLIAAFFLAVATNSLFWTAFLLTESLFIVFLTGSLYFCLRGLMHRSGLNLLAAGALVAVAALIRPVAQYYFVILLSLGLFWPGSPFSLRFQRGLLFALGFIVTLSPWLYRNFELYDSAKITSIQGENLLFWQVAFVRAFEVKKSGQEIKDEYLDEAKSMGYIKHGHPFMNEKIAQKIALDYIATHPFLYLSRWIKGMINTLTNLNTSQLVPRLGLQPTKLKKEYMFTATSTLELIKIFFQTKSAAEIVVGVSVMLMLLFQYLTFLLGSLILFRRRQYFVLTLCITSIIYFIVTGGPIGLARFRLPADIFYFLIGSVYVDYFLSRRSATSYSVTEEQPVTP